MRIRARLSAPSGGEVGATEDKVRAGEGEVRAGEGEVRAEPRPIVLATLSVRIHPSAERMALDSALEVGARLIIANLMTLPPYPATIMLAREYATLPHEEDLEAVRATAARASQLGIPTELLRISSRRPVAALLELIVERQASLVVLGPDLRRGRRLQVRLAAWRLRRKADCLIWIAPGGLV